VSPTTYVDSTGQKLSGANKYTLTFPKGQLPPVNPLAFWSITMYISDNGLWFYPNPLNKLTVSPRDKLKDNKDGSVCTASINRQARIRKPTGCPRWKDLSLQRCACIGPRPRHLRSWTAPDSHRALSEFNNAFMAFGE
jgi:hypothetical protein